LRLGHRVPVRIYRIASDADLKSSKLSPEFRDLPYGLQDSLCTLAPYLVRRLPCSATGPTLDTGGRLTLTRQGLTPRKRRRALLGAITFVSNASARRFRLHVRPLL
jgi:hypothetical protein